MAFSSFLISLAKASCWCLNVSVCLLIVAVERFNSSMADLISSSRKDWPLATSSEAPSCSALPDFCNAEYLEARSAPYKLKAPNQGTYWSSSSAVKSVSGVRCAAAHAASAPDSSRSKAALTLAGSKDAS